MLMTWHTKFSFAKSAGDLENDRLRAQIDDVATLMDMILDNAEKPKEPCFYMWHNHFPALLIAGMIYSMEWTFQRGYEDKTFWKFSRHADAMTAKNQFTYVAPPWFRDPDVARSHRSHLMAAEPASYGEDLWPGTPPLMPLLWPLVANDPWRAPGDAALYELRVAKADLPAVRSGKLVIPDATTERIVNL